MESAKTSFIENILAIVGLIPYAEQVHSGKTVSDYTPAEIERKILIYVTLMHVPWKNTHINFWNTSDASDFIREVVTAFYSSEVVSLVLDVHVGVQIETIKILPLS